MHRTVRYKLARAIRLALLLWSVLGLALIATGIAVPGVASGASYWFWPAIFALGALAALFIGDRVRCESCGASYFDRNPPARFGNLEFLKPLPPRCEYCDFERVTGA